MDLPVILNGSVVLSRPDSGCEENAISLDMAQSLNLVLDHGPQQQKSFKMANGKIVKALSLTKTKCRFAKDPVVELSCTFHVFERLICPIIMGMAFLDETEILSK